MSTITAKENANDNTIFLPVNSDERSQEIEPKESYRSR